MTIEMEPRCRKMLIRKLPTPGTPKERFISIVASNVFCLVLGIHQLGMAIFSIIAGVHDLLVDRYRELP
jgi:hypothetical protein